MYIINVFIRKYAHTCFAFLRISDFRLQTFADIGKNQDFQTYEYANVGCEHLLGFAHA